jgi:photosystem II stability/assembly factor-like uncharacterized protein
MSELLIGTESGLLRWTPGGHEVRPDNGSPPVAHLARGHHSLLATTPEGALWERPEEDGWRLVNEHPVPDEIWTFAADPRLPGRLYLGVSPALLYVSDDGGVSWTACQSIRKIPGYERWTFPPPPHIPHVRSVALHPTMAGALYIGVEEGGVYRTDDRGGTWESLNDGLYWDVHTVTPAPDSSRLYATTGNGFYRSDDGGHQWRHIMMGLDRSYTVPFAVSGANPDQLFVAAAAAPPPSWRNGADAALYRSDDGGEHWTRLSRGLPERFDVMVRAIAVDGDGGVYAASGRALYASRDEGQNWDLVSGDLPTVRALAAA